MTRFVLASRLLITISIIIFWLIGIALFYYTPSSKNIKNVKYIFRELSFQNTSRYTIHSIDKSRGSGQASLRHNNLYDQSPSRTSGLELILVSRTPNVTATCDTRGNLGPCSVVVQTVPGQDWLKDRWQAASDMGGTAIPGPHWVVLDFKRNVIVQAVKLDWETAYADEYRLEGSLKPPSNTGSGSTVVEGWTVIYNSSIEYHRSALRHISTSGVSPGIVTKKLPLHVVHYLNLSSLPQVELRYLRLYIVRPAAGWGVSLWQFDVVGYFLP